MTQRPITGLNDHQHDRRLLGRRLGCRAGRKATVSLLVSLALGGLGMATVMTQPNWLSADQFDNRANQSVEAPAIVPRGADLHGSTVVNPLSSRPQLWNQNQDRRTVRSQPRQANLRQPIFDVEGTGTSLQEDSRSAEVISGPESSYATEPGSSSGVRNQEPQSHIGLPKRDDPFRFDDIPYAGRTQTASSQDGGLVRPPVPPIPSELQRSAAGSVENVEAPVADVPEANYGSDGSPVNHFQGGTGNLLQSDLVPKVIEPAPIMNDPAQSQAGPTSIQGSVATPATSGHTGIQGRPVQQGFAPGTSGFRANVESDAPGWIGPYMGRADSFPSSQETSPAPRPNVVLPSDFSAWWDPMVQQQSGIAPRALPVEVSSLVQKALVHSARVQVLQANPEVEYQVVRQEEAAFDWRAFLDAKYDDQSDPIGSQLTTGTTSGRFLNQQSSGAGGLKRRTGSGGELEIAQKVGVQKNNSQFLVPNPQSTTRLELSFRQPIMNQAGTVYNQSQIVLARINANSSGDETLEELQNHLYSVTDAYWKLYRARAEFFQRQKLLTSAQDVLTTLEARNQVDTIPRQLLRARAAVARAESRMQRAVTDIRNAESQLRLLVNDPEMLNSGPIELTPLESPAAIESPVGLRESLQTALGNRPDISRAIRQMRASGVRLGASKQDILPRLDFIVSTYVAGLEARAQVVESFGDQFSEGRPGYTVGLEFEVPLGNRAAKAKLEQRQWELKRAINGFRATVEASLTEVEIASREVDTAYRELLGKFQAMEAARNEVAYLQDRFAVLPMVEESSMLLLEDLLDGYERLADEESTFSQAQVSYALSIIQLRRATGVLLRTRYDVPEIEASESEWMASRAEQAAQEADQQKPAIQTARNAAVPAPSPDQVAYSATGQVHVPATWTNPVGQRPQATVPVRSALYGQPAESQAKPRAGGHSFRVK